GRVRVRDRGRREHAPVPRDPRGGSAPAHRPDRAPLPVRRDDPHGRRGGIRARRELLPGRDPSHGAPVPGGVPARSVAGVAVPAGAADPGPHALPGAGGGGGGGGVSGGGGRGGAAPPAAGRGAGLPRGGVG